jgi:hypothetical protein
MTASRPKWIRLDLDWQENPKFVQLGAAGTTGRLAVLLWVSALSYSARHLTDGWVPESWPRVQGYSRGHTEALEAAGLWIPLTITDDGGWLINDYAEYQITREEWAKQSERQRRNANRRWSR